MEKLNNLISNTTGLLFTNKISELESSIEEKDQENVQAWANLEKSTKEKYLLKMKVI